jgi:hypothetical protein
MPPKKAPTRADKIKGNVSCTGRDITPLQRYALDVNLGRGFLANLLEQEGYLEQYKFEPILDDLNECQFSFVKSDWFGIYLRDADGNKYFTDSNGTRQPYIYYFKILTTTNGLMIDDTTHTFRMPPELQNARRCIVKNGKCAVEETPKATAPPRATVAALSRPAASPSNVLRTTLSPEVQQLIATAKPASTAKLVTAPSSTAQSLPPDTEAMMEALQISTPARPTGAKPVHGISREEAEAMDLKTLLDWVKANMYQQDILRCIRSGALSAQDRAKLDELETGIPVGGADGGGLSPEDLQAIRMSERMPESEAFKMYRNITRTDLIQKVNQLPQSERQNGILRLCGDANLQYTLKSVRGVPKIHDIYGNIVQENEALIQCASVQAIRLRNIMAQKRQIALGRAREIVKGKMPAMTGRGMTPTQTAKVRAIVEDLLDAKQNGELSVIVEFAQPLGIQLSTNGSAIVQNGNVLSDEDLEDLVDSLAIQYIKTHNVAFGKKRKSKSKTVFARAAKKCKGRGKYRQCMSKTLKKMYRRRSSRFGSEIDNAVNAFKKDILGIYNPDKVKAFLINEAKKNFKTPKLILKNINNRFVLGLKPLLEKHFLKYKDDPNIKKKVVGIIEQNTKKCIDAVTGKLPLAVRITPMYQLGIKPIISQVKSMVSKEITEKGFSAMKSIPVPTTEKPAEPPPSETKFGRKRKCKRSVSRARVIKNFKLAVKKCKGRGKYRQCMKTTLRKMYRRRSSRFGEGEDEGEGGTLKKTKFQIAKEKAKELAQKAKVKAMEAARKANDEFNKIDFEKIQSNISKAATGAKEKAMQTAKKAKEKAMELEKKAKEKMNSFFGKRKRRGLVIKNFKLASKKCKGKAKYRRCMKTTLRKIYRRRKSSFGKRKKMSSIKKLFRSSTKRKSPRLSATSVLVGKKMKGVDGNMWIAKKNKNGVKRWVKM